MKDQIARVLIPFIGLLCLAPWMPSAGALASGAALGLGLGNPYADRMGRYTHKLLAWSVIGLGAGMDLGVVARVGVHGIAYTIVGIVLTLSVGLLLARMLKVDSDAGMLIAVGTAICGGSAIAAVAPVIRAKSQSITVALGTVFVLNAIALITFPPIGHWLNLSQVSFGLWSALAIHDTSSVVGAGLQYGPEALKIAATVKLARALWIVPVTLVFASVFARRQQSASLNGAGGTPGKPKPMKRPWFILGFVIAAALVTFYPDLRPAGHWVEAFAKRGLVVTLFFIGANLTQSTVKSVGVRALVQGFLLWILVLSATLSAVVTGLIN